jgi:amino acid adenylation domain-containing protein
MEKGWEQVVATLAVMQSGAAYLPIDPGLPVERFQYLLEQGGVEVVLTQPALRERLRCPAGVVAIPVTEEEPASEPAALEPVQGPEDLAYVIFTSGSTGLPKGVMIDHRGAVNTILDLNRRFGVGPQDRVLALSRLSFDLSVYDLFGLLAAGGAIVLPESAETREPARWAERIARERVTIWNTVPALMEMLVHDLESRSQPLPPSLSLVLLSGDWIPVTLPDRIRALGENVRVISLGGATEASIWSICHPIDRVDPAWASIPYGRPLSNQTMHVLDEALEPRPASVPGQLYIGGIGLARGYWRDEEKTRVSFLVHPRTGERLYRTGDLGRSLPDGTIEFLGREDFQVKVQGYRVELGEIEAALAEHPAVRAGVVAALGERGQRRLVAYVVLGEEADGGAPIEMTGLRAFLESKLPDYMIPSAFLRLDALPLTANGKLDRGALPAPEDRTAAREETFIGPRDETESELVRIWEELLEARPIGVRDNFFELGGHSLLAVRLTGRIRRRFGRDLPLSVLFAGGTVEHLATVLRGGPEDPARRALLVPIQTAGSKPPFFCVHPIGGSVLCYADLARRLGAEQPFYGLQAPHLDGGAEPALEKLADLYVRELRQVEPEGPYRLGGWSMGGIVAFEMARRLREQGQEVALVALIDAVLPGCGAYPESADEASLAAWFAHDLATLSGRTGDLSPANPGGESEDGGVETAQLRGLYELFGANARALLGYVPGPYAGRVVLFQAGEEPPEVRRRAGLAWRAVAADLETHILPGSHYTLVREPHVRALAERLRSLLEAAPGHLPAELPPSPARRSHDAELSLPT